MLRELHEDDPEGGYRVLSDDIADLGYVLARAPVGHQARAASRDRPVD
ncbi:hypothetical protein FM113_05775 [Leucobacter sp. 7(1)]|nr:hypothetical protein FM113_05775 [Leucobacter sp. 7(1)]